MSPNLRVLSGKDIIKFLEHEGFSLTSQSGSHIKMKRITNFGKQIIVVPNHTEIRKGTQKSIIDACLRYIPEETIMDFFYH